MCLLIVQTKDTVFTEEHLHDFYTRNKDGIGVMWAENGYLHQEKIIPTSSQESVDFYNKFARGKDACIHYRMRTHGDIDHENTHPYEVFGFTEPAQMPMLLMHNGILHTGNDADPSKSDTWHYIRNYLHVLLKNDPELAFSKEFRDIIGKHIGNNRFAMMNHLGEISVVNKHQGVTFRGAWLSNEYAWSAAKYLPPKVYTPTSYSVTGNNVSSWGTWNPVTRKYENDQVVSMDGAPRNPKPYPAKAGKKKHKQKQGSLTTPGGGKMSSMSMTHGEKNMVNGLSVDCKWLDDVLEIRSMLDAFYLENSTSNKQIECMIEEMGITTAYFAVELLGDSLLTEKMWDALSCNRNEMRYFASMPRSQWYPDKRASKLEFVQ